MVQRAWTKSRGARGEKYVYRVESRERTERVTDGEARFTGGGEGRIYPQSSPPEGLCTSYG